jgi:hypothetical protein
MKMFNLVKYPFGPTKGEYYILLTINNMKTELDANDQVEIILNCNDYQNTISGTASELGLLGFPIEWIENSPGEAESQSDIISDFVAGCSEEYTNDWGSYSEFASCWMIDMKVILSDGTVIESKG